MVEQLRANPGWICRWVLPEKDQARTIVKPEMEQMQADCPERLQFHFQTTDSVYIGPNGSQLFLYGVDKDKGKKLRGPKAHIVVADEYGFWNHPRVLKTVLRPQLLTTRGQLIMASTPPEDLGHPYYAEYEKAKRLGRHILRTIYDNGALTPDEIASEMEEQGGAESPGWKREYLCEHGGDPETRVIPEWDDKKNILPNEAPRPDFFDCYTAGDSGADDNTAQLFIYYDFLTDTVVVEDEYVTNGKTTPEIILESLNKEQALWGKQLPHRRVYDADKQLILDINSGGYYVEMADKADKRSSLHNLRERVRNGKFKVRARCAHTLRCFQQGQWKDRKHQDFARNEHLGHLDPIAAAMYGNRCVVTTRNPYPQNAGQSIYTHFLPDASSQGKDKALADVF